MITTNRREQQAWTEPAGHLGTQLRSSRLIRKTTTMQLSHTSLHHTAPIRQGVRAPSRRGTTCLAGSLCKSGHLSSSLLQLMMVGCSCRSRKGPTTGLEGCCGDPTVREWARRIQQLLEATLCQRGFALKVPIAGPGPGPPLPRSANAVRKLRQFSSEPTAATLLHPQFQVGAVHDLTVDA